MTPTPDRWHSIGELYEAALQRPADQRAAFLKQACADEKLRAEVESLLGWKGGGERLMEHSPGASPAPAGPLAAGTRLGSYEILGPLGAGGMGEVYRARDTQLDREAAIKVLPAGLARDPERLLRFEREAKVLASLNHPNIAQVYGIAEGGGVRGIAMELVPGRIVSGPRPLEIVLGYAGQIAAALEAAHDRGVVHRDLKPANIMVRPDGTIKVLDFGLARLSTMQAEDPGEATTALVAPTHSGIILGTAAYMSPEQARGLVVDKRTDIWAFGVVLCELITGQRPFAGKTMTDILANVVKGDPDLSAIPVKLRRLIQSCLEKEPGKRLRDIGDWNKLLQDEIDPATASAWPRFAMASAAVAAVLAITTAVALWAPWRPAPELPGQVRFQIAPPSDVNITANFSLSPDGTKIAFIGTRTDAGARLYVRSMDRLESRALAGTEGVMDSPPFWSPDSRSIAFDGGGQLRKVDVSGGAAQTVCEISGRVVGGSWNREGVIVFGIYNGAGIQRVPAAGGAASAATAVSAARKQRSHLFPVFLPDGRHFLYFTDSADAETRGIYAGSLDASPDHQEARRILATTFAVNFVPMDGGKKGELLFQRDGTLLAQTFDLRRLGTTGEAVPVAEQLGSWLNFGHFAAADNGTLVWRGIVNAGGSHLGWFDRQGKSLGAEGATYDFRGAGAVAISPDGTRVATARNAGGSSNIWLTTLSSGSETRFTFDPPVNFNPAWSGDGNSIAFTSNRAGSTDLYQHASSGAGRDELLLKSDHSKNVNDLSRDGRFLLYAETDPKTNHDLWVLPMDGGLKPVLFLRTEFNELNAKFSPDGHWVAYESDESGRSEVYVRPFPAANGKWLVSRDGGTLPRWRGDGKELYYLAANRNLMAIPVAAGGSAFQPGTPTALFQAPPNPAGWDVTADGGRFLFTVPTGETAQTPFTVVQNWMSLLKK